MLRKKSFHLFSLIILVVSIVFLRLTYHRVADDKENFVSDTQRAFNKVMQAVSEDEAVVLSYLQDHEELNFKELAQIETSFPFFVYKSNQLIFWNGKVLFSEINNALTDGWQFYTDRGSQYVLLMRRSRNTNVVLLFACELYTNYSVSNDYIKPHYNSKIFHQEDIALQQNQGLGAYAIKDNSNNAIFYLKLDEAFTNHEEALHVLIIVLEILAYVFAIILGWFYCRKLLMPKPWLAFLYFFLVLTTLKLVMWTFQFPFQPEELALFDPKFFASSDLNPSFGALLINSLLLFLFGAFTVQFLKNQLNNSANNYNFVLSVFLSFVSFAVFLFIYGFLELIYRHSQWGVDIYNTINLDIFQGLTIVMFLLFGSFVFYVVSYIHSWTKIHVKSAVIFLRDTTFGLLLFVIFAWVIKAPFLWVSVVVLLLNCSVYFLGLSNRLKRISFISFIYLFLFVSAIAITAAWSTSYMESIQEKNRQLSFANRLYNDNDVLAEYLLVQIDESLKTDPQIRNQFLLPLAPYSTVANKIEQYYMSEYFDKYDIRTTIYDASGNALYPKGSASFAESYTPNQLSVKNKRAGIGLYLLGKNEEEAVQKKYVYKHDVQFADYTFASIIIVLIPKKIQPDNVFPELLVDKRFVPNLQKTPYQYGVYERDTLLYKVGGFSFPDHIPADANRLNSLIQTLNKKELNLNLINNGEQSIVFAEDSKRLLAIFSKFSYFFIVCFTVIFLFSIYYLFHSILLKRNIGLSAKIQLFFSLAFLIPLLSISISTISFVNVTFLQDIVRSYQERISRVGDRLTSAVIDYEGGEIGKEILNNRLLNTSKMVNSDLNIFTLEGKLLTTSQPQIFEKKLQSNFINNEAYTKIYYENQKLFTLDEKIGKLNYKTAYSAIYSYNTGDLIAVLSSPFFKSSKEYDDLLANLLTNVFNIFVASFIVFIMLAYAATKVLTQPLTLLKGKLANVNLSEVNEPLKWPVKDEIGLLISEYNDMLLKLEKSKLALAKTEKESAWREMAQQVAHEIKNPLTPMKLSLQHLLMRLEREDNGNEEASCKIKSILSQVDNVSDIATSFSSFAKMPIPDNDRTNVSKILKRVVNLFKADNNHIALNLPEQDVFALVDKKIIERIFNNIIINALQSTEDKESLKVNINLSADEKKIHLSFSDNGRGIPEDSINKIFLPNFTTKQEGSGIGLAIAKRGVEYAGGKIWVESALHKGTTFYIELHKMD